MARIFLKAKYYRRRKIMLFEKINMESVLKKSNKFLQDRQFVYLRKKNLKQNRKMSKQTLH